MGCGGECEGNRSAKWRLRRRQIWPERVSQQSTGICPILSWSRARSPPAKARLCRAAPFAPRPEPTPAAARRTNSSSLTDRPKRPCGGRRMAACRRKNSSCCSTISLRTPRARRLYAQDLYGGADPKYRIKVRVYNELAWHSMFIRALLIRPERSELSHYVPDFTILSLPSFKADPKRHGVRSETIIAIDFTKRIILIGGTSYAGEMKKVGVHHAQLLSAVRERDADALLRQCRTFRRRRLVLRPVRHRQDDAVRRSQSHAHRRRRARLGPAGRVQFRRRLLRQMHQALGRGRTGDLCHHTPLRHGARERGVRPRHARLRLRRRLQRPRIRAPPIRSSSFRTRRGPGAPACRRISCF